MFAADVVSEISKAAQALGIEPAALLAVADVESSGIAFATIGGRREPLIRFEAHYFDRRLSEKNRAVARAKGLAAPVAGAIPNPATQAARWGLLARAVAIDAGAAYESVSWGLGQVMGAHWALLGYASVEALVAQARSGIAGQVRLMTLYIDKTGLAKAMREHDWASFARGYNGPAYAKSGYDRKIAAAYAAYRESGAQVRTPLLRKGMKSEAVAELQRKLAELGYPAIVDGDFGPATQRALKQFQSDQALRADGIVGPKTAAALGAALSAAGLSAGWWTRLKQSFARFFGRSQNPLSRPGASRGQ